MRARRVVPAAGLLVALLAGCSSPPGGVAAHPVPPPPAAGAGAVGAAATTTPAAELRAGTTWQLVVRTHLLAALRGSSAPAGADPQDLAALQADTVGLVRTLGVPPGPLLLALQRETDAVLARPADRPALVQVHRALAPLLLGGLEDAPVARLRDSLDAGTSALLASGTGGEAGAGAAAAGRAADAVTVAAGVIANSLAADRGLGSTETPAVVLRSDLTSLLVGRVFLAALPAAPDGRVDPLDVLALRLAGRLAPGADRDGVLAALRAGHAALREAGAAAAAHDVPRTGRARQTLAAADRDLAVRLAGAVPALPADLVLRALDPVRGRLLAAVGARAAGQGDALRLLVAAAADAPVEAALLAAGVADQRHLA